MRTIKQDHDEVDLCFLLHVRYGSNIREPDATLAERCKRARRLILEREAEGDAFHNGETMGQAFGRVYGEPLGLVRHENGDGV